MSMKLFWQDSIHVEVGCLVGSIASPDEQGRRGIPRICEKVSKKPKGSRDEHQPTSLSKAEISSQGY